jgi:hypothetical protein
MTAIDDDFDGDPHPAWARELAKVRRKIGGMCRVPGTTDEALDPLYDQAYGFMDRIAGTRARTLAGAYVQIRMALRQHHEGNSIGAAEELALENAVATLKRLLAVERRREKRQQQRP